MSGPKHGAGGGGEPADEMAYPAGDAVDQHHLRHRLLLGSVQRHWRLFLDRRGTPPPATRLIAEQKQQPHIAVDAAWSEIGPIARRLVDRVFPGKAVLHLA
jgi:hypothetical protein